MTIRRTLMFGLCSFTLAACSPANNDRNAYSDYEEPVAQQQLETYERSREDDERTSNESRQQDAPVSECQLTLGFDIWEPYQFVDIGEQVRGLDIEIAEATAQLMGCELEFSQATWVDLLHDMQSGDVDMLMGASKTSEREAYAYFSDGYREEQFVLFIREDNQRLFADMDLSAVLDQEMRIGIVDSYFYGDEFQSHYDSARERNGDTQFMNAMMGEFNLVRLLDHDIDGFLEDRVVGQSLIRRKGLAEYITASDIELTADSVYVMFSKESTDQAMVEAFNQALAQLRDNGEYDAILARYLQ
ncbi:MAG: amino acid ABC transporter substrate-binding protein [Idiomarina sp.]|nr:amino acid ABC transporter substrate-binding protein [Idiomarina sp.]